MSKFDPIFGYFRNFKDFLVTFREALQPWLRDAARTTLWVLLHVALVARTQGRKYPTPGRFASTVTSVQIVG